MLPSSLLVADVVGEILRRVVDTGGWGVGREEVGGLYTSAMARIGENMRGGKVSPTEVRKRCAIP